MLRYLSILIYLINCGHVLAQQNPEHKYQFIHYTIDQGLSQASINDLILDKSGYLWIATQDGLNRFDGSSFLVYQHSNKENKGLCGNFINTLLLDENKIWIGTRSSGLCYYDIAKNKFQQFEKLSQNDITYLQKDSSNTIYATLGNNEIAIIKKDTSTNKHNIKKMMLPDSLKLSTTGICVTASGTIWVGTKEGRLFYGKSNKNINKISFVEYELNRKNLEDINIIDCNNENEIWIGTRQVLFKLNVNSHNLTQISLSNNNNITPLIIYDINWKDNEMWVATGSGLFIVKNYNSETRSISIIKHKELNANSLSNNTVTSILFDNEGQSWVGTGKYLNLLYKNPIVNNIKSEVNNKKSLNSNVVFSIQKENNNLWIGTSDGGLNLLKGDEFFAFAKESNQLPSNVIFSTIKDKNGNLWIGSKEGLSIFNNSSNIRGKIEIQNIFHLQGDTTSLSNNFIRQIYQDKDENIWLCTYDGGLNRFTGDITKKIFKFKNYRHQNNNPNSISADRVYCIRQVDNYEYWIGTIKGLAVLTFKNGDFKKPVFSRLDINDSLILTNQVIYDILVSRDRNVWIGTRNGFYHYDKQNNQLEHFSMENGMPNNIVYGILEDNNNKIWVSTNNGISSFNRQSKQFVNYNVEDGFADKEFNLQARFKDDMGLLYFGGINGISFFNPNRMNELDQQNKLYFNRILVTNYKTNHLERLNFETGKPVQLKSNQFPFYVNFSNINLKYHKNTKFAYRLKPDNKKWNFIGKDRQIQFLKLASGDYTLEIQGVSRGRVWKGKEPLKLNISIIPPWWNSKLAYILYLIIFLSVIYFTYKFNLNKKLEHQQKLRLMEIDELKTTFYTNITHELRTPLTVILGVTEDINENLNENEKLKYRKKLNVLARNSRKLLQLINQILDLSKIENSTLVLKTSCSDIIHFLKITTESFHSLARHKNIEFVYYNEIESLCMDFDREKFLIIISNLLSNAIKFTPDYGKIIVHVKKEKDPTGKFFLIIKIKDTGIGINSDDLENIFDRFFQAKKSNPDIAEGTGIGLAIVKEYIYLMKGSIKAENNVDKGTVFTLKLPISNKAVKEKEEVEVKSEKAQTEIDSELDSPNDLNTPLLLIVEDNYDVANYIASFVDTQYQVIFAKDGEEGVKKAIKYIPDIIITDLMMPKTDGFELCNTLKNDPITSHIPIIMLTARSLDQDKLKGYSV
ncbi:MAG: hypothetical protein DRJ10_10130, partial [Bacteroidetes bacterium]